MAAQSLVSSVFKYINMLNDETYQQYIVLFVKYCSEELGISGKKTSPIKHSALYFKVNDGEHDLKVYFPTYVNVYNKIAQLEAHNTSLDENDSTHHEIDTLKYYLEVVNHDQTYHVLAKLRQLELDSTFKDVRNDIDKLIESVYSSSYDQGRVSLTKELLSEANVLYTDKNIIKQHNLNAKQSKPLYKSMVSALNNITTLKENIETISKNYIDYYIESLPRIEVVGKTIKKHKIHKQDEYNSESESIKSVGKDNKTTKATKTTKTTKTSKTTKATKRNNTSRSDTIKNAAKAKLINKSLLGKFVFTSKTECITKDSKKPYYISVKDMKNVIEDDPDLKKAFPKNFKKLRKEELCDVFFD